MQSQVQETISAQSLGLTLEHIHHSRRGCVAPPLWVPPHHRRLDALDRFTTGACGVEFSTSESLYLGVKATTGEIIVGNRGGLWLTMVVRRKPEGERGERNNLNKIVGVLQRKNEDDPETDGEKTQREES